MSAHNGDTAGACAACRRSHGSRTCHRAASSTAGRRGSGCGIRCCRVDDLADLVVLAGNWEVAQWVGLMPHPYTVENGREWIIIAKLAPTQPEDSPWLLHDDDRLWHPDYFARMLRDVAPRREIAGDPVGRLSPSNLALMENDFDQMARWKNAHLERMEREIEMLGKLGAGRAAAKWKWFKKQFQRATNRIG